MAEIAFVGNAPSGADISHRIDGADWVVRFNNPVGYQVYTGNRIDDLFLINCGGQMHEWLRSSSFWSCDAVRSCRYISLPIENLRRTYGRDFIGRIGLDGINFERDVRVLFADRPGRVRTLPERVRRNVIKTLQGFGDKESVGWPSTGVLAMGWYLSALPEGTVLDLYNFNFSGWKGHSWAAERAWVEAQVVAGRIRWHRTDLETELSTVGYAGPGRAEPVAATG